jgi:predicted protein tyrosine phosphatase
MFNQILPVAERIFEGTCLSFLVLSRAEMSKFSGEKPYLVISVTDSEKVAADIPESVFLRAILRLKFDDVGKPDKFSIGSKDVPMNEEHAEKIIKFVEKHLSEISLITCHCEQGISRSAAIAAALSKALQPQDRFPTENYWINSWVYDLVISKADFGKDG